MCTVVVLLRPGHAWPVLIAANRDEMLSRPWQPPAAHWPDRPGVVAGLDELAGGSWLGINREGVLAGILNRHGSLGPAEGRRSRGELVLEALDHADADLAARALAELDTRAYRTFNMVVIDNSRAFWLRNLGEEGPGRIELFPLAPGYSMIATTARAPASAPTCRASSARPSPTPSAASGPRGRRSSRAGGKATKRTAKRTPTKTQCAW
jgi:uncharacterized protein with NRDE domain